MAAILVAAAGATIAQGTTGAALFAITAATAAASLGAAFLDQKFLYPKLFPSDSPQTPGVLGLDTMTGDDGSPGHTSWGRSALVGGHVLFFENLQEYENRSSSKKGGGAVFKKRTADVGIGWTKNLIQSVDQIHADQKLFYRKSPNVVTWLDYRATVVTSGAGARLLITPTTGDSPDFAPIFVVGDVVRVSHMLTAPNGLWRVYAVGGHGVGGATPYGFLELSPLQGQTPSAGSAGSTVEPLEIQRIDAAIVDHLAVPILNSTGFTAVGVLVGQTALTIWDVNSPNGSSTSHYPYRIKTMLPAGHIVRFSNFTGPAGINGQWIIRSASQGPLGTTFALTPVHTVTVSPDTPATHASASNPGRIELDDIDGFIEPVANQIAYNYLGTLDEGPDPTLSAIYGSGDTHGYRGLARTTIEGMNISNFGDRVPQMSAVVLCNVRHTTHDCIRDVMREAFRGDDSRYDLSILSPDRLLGYTRRGAQTSSATLQPLSLAYGIESQERGEVWTFFKPAEADLHQLGELEFGAYVGDDEPQKFQHMRIQERDLPRRLSFFYRDPTNDFARTEKKQRTSGPDDPQDQEIAVDVDPLVLYPWDAQNSIDRIYGMSIVGRDQAKITVPPSRIDILPNDRVTLTALNWDEEDATIVAGAIDHQLQITEVEGLSVSIEVDFETYGGFRLVDDGDGALTGYPPEVTPSTNVVDYDAGTVEFAADDDIITARVRYEFPNPWRMRVQQVTRRVNRLTELSLVSVAERFPVIGSPVQVNNPAVPVVIRPAQISSHVLDIAAVSIPYVERAGLFYAAAPLPGSTWRGAGVYSSEDGISYTLRSTIENPTPMGEAGGVLADADPGVVDWQEVVVRLDYGTLSDATLAEIESGVGINWLLWGDEIVAFQSAVLNGDGTYTLSGFIRGLRDTADAMAGHAAGDRIVLLGFLGFPGYHGTFEEFARPSEVGRTLSFKIVPAGGVIDDYDAVEVTPQAENVRPFAPANVIQGDLATYGYDYSPGGYTYDADVWLTDDVVVRWFRRSRSILSTFGAGSSAPLMEPFERYQVDVLLGGTVVRTEYVGGTNTGSQMVHRTFRYTLAMQTADGFTAGDLAEFQVRQIGQFRTSRAASIEWAIPV